MDPWETKEPPEDEKTSIWKKEISFRRKQKAEVEEVVEEVVEEAIAPPPPPVPDVQPLPAAPVLASVESEPQPEPEPELEPEPQPEAELPEHDERRPSRKERREDARRAKREEKAEAKRLKVDAKRRAEEDKSFAKRRKAEDKRAAKERPRERRSLGRKKRLVGLKIGGSQLAAARVVNNGAPELVQIAREPLEAGIVVGGELRQPDALATALRSFFKKHKLPRTGVRLGIASNRIGVRTFEISGIDDPKQLANAIRFRAQEALPIPLDEAVLDYQVLSERSDESGGLVRRVLLVVAYRDLIDRYAVACRKAGIKLAGIDLEAFGTLRALTVPRADDVPARAATVVVSIGHDRSPFGVSDGRHCEFTRVLEWGGASLNVAIARALDITPSQAEPIKLALSLREPVTPAGLTKERADQAREAVQRELHAFARELVSSLQFYQNQPGSLGIGEIVLTGGTAGLAGIDTELHKLIGVPVRVGDPLARVKVGKKVREREGLDSLSTAIGLGIEN